MRVGVAVLSAVASYVAVNVLSILVSLAADPGGPRGNLEDGTVGVLWFLIGGYLAWYAATTGRPAARPTNEAAGQ